MELWEKRNDTPDFKESNIGAPELLKTLRRIALNLKATLPFIKRLGRFEFQRILPHPSLDRDAESFRILIEEHEAILTDLKLLKDILFHKVILRVPRRSFSKINRINRSIDFKKIPSISLNCI